MPSPVNGITPVAWYDVDASTSTTAITDNSGNSRADLAFGSGNNAPVYLDFDGAPYVWLPGDASNRNNTVNVSSYNVTDLEFWIDMSFASWTPSTLVPLLERHGADPNRQFRFELGTDGKVTFRWYPTGNFSSELTAVSTNTIATATGVAAGGRVAVRVTLDVDTGSGREVKFYYRLNGYDGTWDDWQTFTSASATSLPTGVNRVLEHGGTGGTTAAMKLYGMEFLSGLGGSVLAEYKPANIGQTTYTDGAGRAWTAPNNRASTGRKSVSLTPRGNASRSVLLAGTDDWLDAASGTAMVPSATAGSACTLAAVIRPWATQAAGKIIATTRATTTAKGVSIEMAGTSSVRAVVSDGTTTVTSASVNITLGRRTVVGVILTGGSPGTVRVFEADSSGVTLGATSNRTGNDETGGDLRCFADQSGGNVIDVESECPWISFDSALTSAQIDQIWAYYDNSGRAEVAAGVTAAAYQAATNASSGPGTAAATADAQQAGTGVTAPAEVAATVTAAAYDATGSVSVYPDTASVTASANGVGSNATTTTTTATVTAAANAAGSGVTAPAGTATVTATANAAGSSATTVVQLVAAVVAAALNALGDSVKQQALRATFIERTRATFRETRSP